GWKVGRIPTSRVVFGTGMVVAVSLATVVYWRRYSPMPLHPFWDGPLHLAVVRRMTELSQFSDLPSRFTSGFRLDPYMPGMHLRIAMVSWITGVPAINVFWA